MNPMHVSMQVEQYQKAVIERLDSMSARIAILEAKLERSAHAAEMNALVGDQIPAFNGKYVTQWGEFQIPPDLAIRYDGSTPLALPKNKRFWEWLDNQEVQAGKPPNKKPNK